ncbi:MAG: hypothetical protein ACRYF3_03375 [Janthinobacterium lividum]
MDATHRTPCVKCGHLLRDADTWCPLCHEPAPDLRFRSGPAATVRADDHAGPPPPPLRSWRQSRWRGSEVTFGPIGRIVCTLLLLVPVYPALSFSPVAGISYLFVLLPWGLRDVWRRVRVNG